MHCNINLPFISLALEDSCFYDALLFKNHLLERPTLLNPVITLLFKLFVSHLPHLYFLSHSASLTLDSSDVGLKCICLYLTNTRNKVFKLVFPSPCLYQLRFKVRLSACSKRCLTLLSCWLCAARDAHRSTWVNEHDFFRVVLRPFSGAWALSNRYMVTLAASSTLFLLGLQQGGMTALFYLGHWGGFVVVKGTLGETLWWHKPLGFHLSQMSQRLLLSLPQSLLTVIYLILVLSLHLFDVNQFLKNLGESLTCSRSWSRLESCKFSVWLTSKSLPFFSC